MLSLAIRRCSKLYILERIAFKCDSPYEPVKIIIIHIFCGPSRCTQLIFYLLS